MKAKIKKRKVKGCKKHRYIAAGFMKGGVLWICTRCKDAITAPIEKN